MKLDSKKTQRVFTNQTYNEVLVHNKLIGYLTRISKWVVIRLEEWGIILSDVWFLDKIITSHSSI